MPIVQFHLRCDAGPPETYRLINLTEGSTIAVETESAAIEETVRRVVTSACTWADVDLIVDPELSGDAPGGTPSHRHYAQGTVFRPDGTIAESAQELSKRLREEAAAPAEAKQPASASPSPKGTRKAPKEDDGPTAQPLPSTCSWACDPILNAASGGHAAVVEILFPMDSHPEPRDAIRWCAENGYTPVRTSVREVSGVHYWLAVLIEPSQRPPAVAEEIALGDSRIARVLRVRGKLAAA